MTVERHATPALARDPPAPALPGRLPRSSFAIPVPDLARRLLGLCVVREGPEGVCVGRIVETEAYGGPEDLASHARAGRTARTAPMFGPPGHAYVYLVYGMHHCLNVVAETDGVAGAVLVRALEPLAGIALMRRRRGDPGGPVARLAAGPARLTQALAIDRSLDGADLVTDPRLWIGAMSQETAVPADGAVSHGPGVPGDDAILTGPRVGVAYAGPGWADRAWRFGLRASPSLSRAFPSLSRPFPQERP